VTRASAPSSRRAPMNPPSGICLWPVLDIYRSLIQAPATRPSTSPTGRAPNRAYALTARPSWSILARSTFISDIGRTCSIVTCLMRRPLIAGQHETAAARRDLCLFDTLFSNTASRGAMMTTDIASSICAIGPCLSSPAA
jgi:hypothetical protein